MIKKKILNDNRIRRISGSFGFIPHRFLTDGFLTALDQDQLLLYFFLVLVSDRYGLSYYGYDSICTALGLSLEQYIDARDSLIETDLIDFDGTIFQVLELPAVPPAKESNSTGHSADIKQLLKKTLKEVPA